MSNSTASFKATALPLAGAVLALSLGAPALAKAKKATNPTAEAPSSEPQNQDVGNLRQHYWNRAEDADLDVVQNRIYSKAGKFEIGGFGGVLLTDPFLSVTAAGASLGYHFSEFLGVRAFGWKSFSSPSSAYTGFETQRSAVPLVNNPKSFLGAEISPSLVYGKVSFLGKSIIYYDLHVSAGGGVTSTDNGNYVTPFLGLGQQIYLSQTVALTIDYRLMAYHENIVETEIPTNLGNVVSTRTNWTNAVTLGISFLLGGGNS